MQRVSATWLGTPIVDDHDPDAVAKEEISRISSPRRFTRCPPLATTNPSGLGLRASDKENRMWSKTDEVDHIKRLISHEERLHTRRSVAEIRGQHQPKEVQLQKPEELQEQNVALKHQLEALEPQQHGGACCTVCASRRDRNVEIETELAKLRDTHLQNHQRLRQHLANGAEQERLREDINEESHRFVDAAKHVKHMLHKSEAKRVASKVVHDAVVKFLLSEQYANRESEEFEEEVDGTSFSELNEIQKLRREVANLRQRADRDTRIKAELRVENAHLLEACSVALPDGYAPRHKRIQYVSQLKQENNLLRAALTEATNARWEKTASQGAAARGMGIRSKSVDRLQCHVSAQPPAASRTPRSRHAATPPRLEAALSGGDWENRAGRAALLTRSMR